MVQTDSLAVLIRKFSAIEKRLGDSHVAWCFAGADPALSAGLQDIELARPVLIGIGFTKFAELPLLLHSHFDRSLLMARVV